MRLDYNNSGYSTEGWFSEHRILNLVGSFRLFFTSVGCFFLLFWWKEWLIICAANINNKRHHCIDKFYPKVRERSTKGLYIKKARKTMPWLCIIIYCYYLPLKGSRQYPSDNAKPQFDVMILTHPPTYDKAKKNWSLV